MKVVFRVDASVDIGTGHVMRCVTLAKALQEQGAECHFICRDHPGNLIRSIENSDFSVSPLSDSVERDTLDLENDIGDLAHAAWLCCNWRVDAAQTLEILEELKPTWLVVDHYALDSLWEAAIRQSVDYLLAIDDLADRKHNCDILLDQNLGRTEGDYSALVPKHCKLLVGPEYALLRPEFLKLREYSLERRRKSKLQHVLVFMGGIDKDNVTGQVLDAFGTIALPHDLEVVVVMGQNAPWLGSVQEQIGNLPYHVTVRVNINDMAQRMADSDLAIGAAGSTSWERCCVGLPAVIFALAENQQPGCQELAQAGAVIALNSNGIATTLPSTLRQLLRHPEELQEMSERSSRITKGGGVTYLTKYLSEVVQNDVIR